MGSSKGNIVAGIIGVLFFLGIITGLIAMFTSMRIVGTGEIGVVTQYGKVTGRELSEGFSWVKPFGINNVTKYDIKTQKQEVESKAATNDLQDVKSTLVLNYKLNSGDVSRMHKEVGKSTKKKL